MIHRKFFHERELFIVGKFLHSKYNSLTPYDTSGESESLTGYIRLNTNESPYPPSPKAIEYAHKESHGMNYYSDPDCRELAVKLAELMKIKPSQIVFGNGSDEILNFIFMAFCENGAAFPDITYSFYKVLAEFHGVNYVTVPLRDFKIYPEDYADINHRTLFIANPNAPTGIALNLNELERIINLNPDSLIVIDEAYVDFGAESAVRFIDDYDNVIVVRTFSKSRSLAGGRLGWCMTNEELANDIMNIKNSVAPYNINAMTQAAGTGTLEDEEYTQKNIKLICEEREHTRKALCKMGFDVLDSKTNFLFTRHESISGIKIFEALKERHIMIRHFSNPKINDWNRITIGTHEQMQAMLKALKEIII